MHSTLEHAADGLDFRKEAVANAMDRAADYLHSSDIEDVLLDVRRVVKRHPGAALLTAAAVGFLLLRALSRR